MENLCKRVNQGAYDKTRACSTTADMAAGGLDRVLRFSRQFRLLRTHAHSADVFGGNITATHKLLLLSRFTEFTFCLDFF